MNKGCVKVRSKEIGIDLGTTNTLIYLSKDETIINEPSIVAIETETKKVIAVGDEAYEMVGRTPGKMKAINPINNGVIADFELTEILIKRLIQKASPKKGILKPKILICHPTNTTPVEKTAIKEVAQSLGASHVHLEEYIKLASIGTGLELSKPQASMIVDIGGGTTDMAVLSMNDIVVSTSLPIAGNTLDQDLIKYIKEKHKMLIGEKTAQEIKIDFASVYQPDKKKKMQIKGRSLLTGLPSTAVLTQEETEEALRESIEKIIANITSLLEKTPPELSADIVDKGLVLTGGSTQLKGLIELLNKQLEIPVMIADRPFLCVIEGMKTLFLQPDRLEYKK